MKINDMMDVFVADPWCSCIDVPLISSREVRGLWCCLRIVVCFSASTSEPRM